MVVLMAGDAGAAGGDERTSGGGRRGLAGFPHFSLIFFNLPTDLLRLCDRLVVLGGWRIGTTEMLREVRAVLGTALVPRGSLG